jgi:hypothetical protein
MDGYPIPEPTGPVAKEIQATVVEEPPSESQSSSALSYAASSDLDARQEGKLDRPVETLRQHEASQMNILAEQVVQNATNKAMGVLMAENALAQKFIDNPQLLPEEVRAKINSTANISEVDPFAYANALVDLATNSQVMVA